MENERRGLNTAIMCDNRNSNEMSASNETHQLIDEAEIKREPHIKEEPQSHGDFTEFPVSDHHDGNEQSPSVCTRFGDENDPMDLSIDEFKSEVKEELGENNGNSPKPNISNEGSRVDVADNHRDPSSGQQRHDSRQQFNGNEKSACNPKEKTKAGTQASKSQQHQCEQCGYSAKYVYLLKKHLLTHTGEKPFPCHRCDTAFTRKQYLRDHLKLHAEEFQFHCVVCLMGFDRMHEKIEHEIHCKAIRYECHLCNKFFGSSKGNLIKHMLVHSGSTPFECKECSKQFTLKSSLKKHMKMHGGPRSFRCAICREWFAQQNEVIQHEMKCNRRVYECFVCGKSIGLFKSNFEKHMCTHTGIKPFRCNQCPLKFVQKGHLNAHIRIRSRSLPWKCVICRQGFSMQTQRNAHQRNCRQRVYECYVCPKFFGSLCTNLKGHMLTHSGQKPFRCEVCGNRFTRKSSLPKHMKTIHNRHC